MKAKMTKMKTGGATAKRTPKAKNGTVTKRVPKAENGMGTAKRDTLQEGVLHGINSTLGLNDSKYTSSKGVTTVKHTRSDGKQDVKVTFGGKTYSKVIKKKGGTTAYKKGGVSKRK